MVQVVTGQKLQATQSTGGVTQIHAPVMSSGVAKSGAILDGSTSNVAARSSVVGGSVHAEGIAAATSVSREAIANGLESARGQMVGGGETDPA